MMMVIVVTMEMMMALLQKDAPKVNNLMVPSL